MRDAGARRRVVDEWLAEYGPVCPGWERKMHEVEARELTADHVRSGEAALSVLCRGCNGRKKDAPSSWSA